MRKAIQLFIENEQVQLETEEAILPFISRSYTRSLKCFQRSVPSVYRLLKTESLLHNSIFANKDGELDIVESNSGNVFYGKDVTSTVFRHVQQYLNSPQKLTIKTTEDNSKISDDKALVVFGIGLGLHLFELIRSTEVKHVVIYEPNVDFLVCSLYAGVWPKIFDLAQKKKVSLYFQVPNNGKSLFSDLCELYGTFGISSLFIYFHYYCHDFDDIRDELCSNNWEIRQDLRESLNKRSFENYILKWPPVITGKHWSSKNLNYGLFKKNLEAFESYFPEIANEFSNYKAKNWEPMANSSGKVNLMNIRYKTFLLNDDVKEECENLYTMFKENPSRDELVLNYSGGKLYPHFHYRTAVRVQNRTKSYATESSNLNNHIKSLLIFGLGAGYQLESLINNHDIDKLFIYEPNRDFFYASLFSIDWGAILKTVDVSEGSLYLNIGDDGSNLVKDLLTQFDRVGKHTLANMFLFKSYDNDILEPVLNNLREEIRLVVGLSDNFDNSRYIIAHTKWAVENNVKYLLKNSKKSQYLNDVPVFVVGNGPSLDNLLPVLKEEHSKAIVISCGTALQVLHKNNIVPDYHVDLEINRSPYDWLVRIDDKEYLKKINLISGNGVHPDVISMYKNAFLSLRSGEPATLIVESIFKELSFVSLKYSYPTVSNFAIDFAVEIGFKQIYLFGVDLGFIDIKHHHSVQSGYYLEDGKEFVDYSKAYNTSLVVEGNLRPFVNTKYEFKMSRSIIELALEKASRDVDVYNLNDGAKIKFTRPLQPENILIQSDSEKKSQVKEWLEESAHQKLDRDVFSEHFDNQIKNSDLLLGINLLKKQASKTIKSISQAESLIADNRKLIIDFFRDNKPVVIYYLHGSVNYINTVLSKALNISDENECLKLLNEIQDEWNIFLSDISESMKENPYELDFVTWSPLERIQICCKEHFVEQRVRVSCESACDSFKRATKILTIDDIDYYNAEKVLRIEIYDKDKTYNKKNNESLVFIVESKEELNFLLSEKTSNLLIYLPTYFYGDKCEFDLFVNKETYAFFIAIIAAQCKGEAKVILPKLVKNLSLSESSSYLTELDFLSQFNIYESHYYNVFSSKYFSNDEMITELDERFRFLPCLREENLTLAL